MKNVNPLQLIFSSIGMAIGIYFAAKYGILAFMSMIGNQTEAIVVLGLAVVIAGFMLIKYPLKMDWFLNSDEQ